MFINTIAIKLTQMLLDKDIIAFDDWNRYLNAFRLIIIGFFCLIVFLITMWSLSLILAIF